MRFLQMSFSLYRVRSSSLEKDIKGLKRREKFEAENLHKITHILDINSSNRMFCLLHEFIGQTLSLNQ